MSEKIKGTVSVCDYCKCSRDSLKRMLAYYDFPKPSYKLIKKRKTCTWVKSEVDEWLSMNKLERNKKGAVVIRQVLQ